ncbi:hypothetical protein GCM10010206_62750 [Streptomyces cinerochromogenes]|nr:hypothetical protein GCM10010206_62750 [Streptomyces cinerochromogenes]
MAAVAKRPGLVSSRLPRLRRHFAVDVRRKGDESAAAGRAYGGAATPEGLVMGGAGRAPWCQADGPRAVGQGGGRRMPECHEYVGNCVGLPGTDTRSASHALREGRQRIRSESIPCKRFDGRLRPAEGGVNGVPQDQGGSDARAEARRFGPCHRTGLSPPGVRWLHPRSVT